MKRHVAALGVFLAIAYSCYGQTNTASISGIVTDTQGAVIPGATVVAINQATGVSNKTVSDQSGLYSIPNLPVSQYTLRVDHPGFSTYLRTGINLHTSQVLGLNVIISVGTVKQTVTVNADAPLLETRTSDFSQNIESKSIENLPLGNRRTMNIIQLSGAAVFLSDSPNSQPFYSLAGGRMQTQMVWIDGSNGQNIRLGAGQQNVDPPVETIQDIQVLSNSYSAEYGGGNGGTVVETTKSGTNQFHGTLYEFLRNDILNAPGYFATLSNGHKISPELRYNIFGGTLGGPIRHNKTFFFLGYEGGRQRTGAVTILTVPTLLQRSGNFSQTFNAQGQLVPIYDPATTQTINGTVTRTQFSGNIIPTAALDPVAIKLLSYYPLPNQAPSNISGANNFRRNETTSFINDFILLKIDHNLSDKDKLIGRYIFYRAPTTVISSVYPDPGADPAGVVASHSNVIYGSWTRIMSPTKVNDFRVTYTNRLAISTTRGRNGNYPQKVGLTGVPGNYFPYIAPAGFSTIGSAAQYRKQAPVAQYQFLDNFSWVMGRHALKFGMEARQSIDDDLNLPTAAGSFTFATQATGLPGNAATGSGLASLLVGFPTAFTELEVDKIERTNWYYGVFAQDDWAMSPDLTLNLGLRWEIDTPMVDANNRMNGFDSTQINPVSGTPGVVKFAGVNGYPRTPYRWDINNFGPRFGFAWKPFKSTNTVVRGGFGIFFGAPFDGPVPSVALGFQDSATLNSPDNGITAPFYLRNGVPVTPTPPTLSDSYGAVPVGQNANTTVTYFDRNRSTSYSQEFTFDLQRELPGQSLIDFSFLGNLSRKLPGSNLSTNQIAPGILGPNSDSQSNRPFPQFSDVQIVAPSIGLSNYYAGVARYEKRYTHGLNVVASYTWSKWLSDTNATANGPGANYSNYYNQRADYGPALYDISQHFTFSSVYELPFGPERAWLSHGVLGQVIGGWALGNLTTIESGFPVTITAQTNTTNSFSAGSLRPNVSGDPNLPKSARSVAHWFNTAAFSQPAPFQFGNAGVGIVRAPGLVDLDFSLIRQFRFTDRIQMQVRGEAFNSLNHPNFSSPGAVFGSAAFGTITSETQARQVQVGAKVTF